MTYNIQQLYNLGPKTWWDQGNRAARIPQAIKKFCAIENQCPDILVLNEAFNSYASKIAQELQVIFPYQTPVVGKSRELWEKTTGTFRASYTVINGGVMVLSRHEILEQRQHIFHAAHPLTWDCWSNKGIAYAKIDIDGNIVHVVGSHLQADEGPVPHEATHRVRMEQIQELRQFIVDELGIPKDERVIVGGDMNVEYTTESFRKEFESVLSTTIFYDHKMPGSFSAPHNWMTRANARANKESESRNETLDYVVVPNDYAQPTNTPMAQIIPFKSIEPFYWSYLAKHWPMTKGLHSDLSDHYPVMATFTFATS